LEKLASFGFDPGELFIQTGVLAHSDRHALHVVAVFILRREAVDLAFEVKKVAGQVAAEPDASGAQFRERAFGDALANCECLARTIPRAVRALVVEGNYLLLDQEPWSSLRATFDMTVAVDAPEDILRQRLIERWQGYGLPPPEIKAKVEGNDLPNGRYVVSKSGPADFVLRS
jgi:hypothetical protein